VAAQSPHQAFSGECRDLVELVTDYLDGVLSPQVTAAVEAHLAICPGCAEYLAQIRQTIAATGELRQDDLSPQTQQVLLDAFRDLLG
jgi:anti-sigma factor RsiW